MDAKPSQPNLAQLDCYAAVEASTLPTDPQSCPPHPGSDLQWGTTTGSCNPSSTIKKSTAPFRQMREGGSEEGGPSLMVHHGSDTNTASRPILNRSDENVRCLEPVFYLYEITISHKNIHPERTPNGSPPPQIPPIPLLFFRLTSPPTPQPLPPPLPSHLHTHLPNPSHPLPPPALGLYVLPMP